MYRLLLVPVFVCAMFRASHGTFFFPIAAGKQASRAIIGAYAVKLALLGAVMQGLHVGYRRGRSDEYERIVEVLDVPEDVYVLHNQRKHRAEVERANRDRERRRIWKKLFGGIPYPDDIGISDVDREKHQL